MLKKINQITICLSGRRYGKSFLDNILKPKVDRPVIQVSKAPGSKLTLYRVKGTQQWYLSVENALNGL